MNYSEFCKRFPITDDKFGRFGWAVDQSGQSYPRVYRNAALAGKARKRAWRYETAKVNR